MKKKLLSVAVGAACLAVSQSGWAILVTTETNATNLANALLSGGGTGIDLTSVTATLSGFSTSSGTYTNLSGTYGIGGGVVLSSGDVNSYNDGPNNTSSTSTIYGPAATAAQQALLVPVAGAGGYFDVTHLDIHFDMLAGFTDVSFNTAFGSEEWPEFVNSGFIDGFGLYVNGVNIAFVGGNAVNINNPFMAAAPGTELDGVLSNSAGLFVNAFTGAVNPTNNTITFIIADKSDTVLDTTVYISQLGGGTIPPPIVNPTVPEPASLALFGIGLTGLAAARRRKSAV